MVGFAGPRVIRETTHQDLPERFQTAEFLEEHGLIDMIVHRKKMRAQIAQFLTYFSADAVKRGKRPSECRDRRHHIEKRSPGFTAPSVSGSSSVWKISARLFAALDFPRRNQRIIHVAGTNGKGSVCAMIDSICRAQGYRTGLFTSPHLVTFRERIQVNGEMISEERRGRAA